MTKCIMNYDGKNKKFSSFLSRDNFLASYHVIVGNSDF